MSQKKNMNELSVEVYDENKLKRTLGTFCAFVVNVFLMYSLKVELGANFVLFFYLLTLIGIVYSIVKKDFSILFSAFGIAFVPFILYAGGLSVAALTSVVAGLFVVFFMKNLTIQDVGNTAYAFLSMLGKETVKKRIIKLAKSTLEPEQLVDEDIKEFKDIESELVKFNKFYAKENVGMKNAMSKVVQQIETLQLEHARVLVRAAALRNHLSSISIVKIKNEITQLEKEMTKATDEVLKSQITATVQMKKQRIEEIESLNTNLSRVKMQKLQMREMFDGLLSKMNTLKLADVTMMQSSSDNMVKEVELIRDGLADLENGLLEIEKQSKQAIIS